MSGHALATLCAWSFLFPVPIEIITTNAGRLLFSLPSP